MKRLFEGFQRALDNLSSPRYPEYNEYRDIDSDHRGQPADQLPGGDDLKYAKLKWLTFGTVILCTVLVIYLHYTEREAAAPPASLQRGQVSEEMLRNINDQGALGQSGKKESLEDVQRWAAEMDQRIQKELNATSPMPTVPEHGASMPHYYGQDRARVDTYSNESIGWLLTEDTGAGTSRRSTSRIRPSEEPMEDAPGAATLPTAAAPTPAQQSASVPPADAPSETRINPYARREYEPARIEPRSYEPY